MTIIYWNRKKGKFQNKPPLTLPEKLLIVLMIPMLLMAAYAIGSAIYKGKKEGKTMLQIVNS